jgi:hypothetical protein
MTNESADGPQLHWLFKPSSGGFVHLGIEVLPDGDYWVYDSPTGTYAAGHGDKGKWRVVYEQYLAEGYVSEHEAKATGLVPPSWTRLAPSPPWARRRRIGRVWATAIVLGLLATSAVLAWLSWAR